MDSRPLPQYKRRFFEEKNQFYRGVLNFGERYHSIYATSAVTDG